MKPRLLDLFCGAGGAAMGYHRAGFEVVGVDIKPQPRFPFEFYRADVLDLGPSHFASFDVVHASPPCQGYSDLRHRTGRDYPRLIEAVRDLLRDSGLPYVIENVEGAPLLEPIRLCGSGFPGLRVLRHRLFESDLSLLSPGCRSPHPLVFTRDRRKAHFGLLDETTAFVSVNGGGNCSVAAARNAMGIDWMTKAELNEAVPPAYTEWIGGQLLTALEEEAA